MCEPYALVGGFLSLFVQSGILEILRSWERLFGDGKRYRLDGTNRLRRETQPPAVPSDDNPRKAIAALQAVSVDSAYWHGAPPLTQHNAR
jgi:hypothetical protein